MSGRGRQTRHTSRHASQLPAQSEESVEADAAPMLPADLQRIGANSVPVDGLEASLTPSPPRVEAAQDQQMPLGQPQLALTHAPIMQPALGPDWHQMAQVMAQTVAQVVPQIVTQVVAQAVPLMQQRSAYTAPSRMHSQASGKSPSRYTRRHESRAQSRAQSRSQSRDTRRHESRA